ncbi:MAG: hypothetical protein V1792_27140 [Pseudomonadota bacterium]
MPNARFHLLVYGFVAVSLCVTYYYNCYMFSTWGPVDRDSVYTFRSFSRGLEEYCSSMRKEWRPRIFSNFLASFVVKPTGTRHGFAEGVAAWNAAWLGLCFAIYLLWDPRKAAFLIFGTFACLYYSFTIMADRHIYPWDMPALFFYCLLAFSAHRKMPLLILAACLVGTGFKETVMLGSAVFLFRTEWPMKTRVAWAATTLLLCLLLKAGIDIFTYNQSILFTMQTDSEGPLVMAGVTERGIWYNLRALGHVYLNHPVFINGGRLLVFLLLPMRDDEDRMWKTVGVLFVAGNMLFADINEYRVFHEMIPISLWSIYKHFSCRAGKEPPG